MKVNHCGISIHNLKTHKSPLNILSDVQKILPAEIVILLGCIISYNANLNIVIYEEI